MKKKTTYKQLIEVVNVINTLKGDDNPLTRKCVRFVKNIRSHIDDYNEALTEINEKYALTDDSRKGAFILDKDGRLSFSKEQSKAKKEDIKKLSETEIEVNIVNCDHKPSINALDYAVKVALNGYVFNIPDIEDTDDGFTSEN